MALRSLFTALVAAAVAVQSTLAHSTQRNPLNYATRLQDPVIQTPGRHVHAYSSFDLTFLLHDGQQKIRLRLEPNHDVLHDDAHIVYLNPDGTTRAVEPVDRTEHKVFKGQAFIQHDGRSEWTNAGWARIMIHRDGPHPIFEGSFRIDGDHHHIQTGDNYYKLKHEQDPHVHCDLPPDEHMVVWRDSDIIPYYGQGELKRDIYGRSSCDADTLSYNAEYRPLEDRDLRGVSPSTLFGRDAIDSSNGNNGAGVNLVSTIGNSAGCPNTRKVALVGIATDCTYTASFNSTQSVRQNIIQQINAASEVYESTFNISLGIMNMTINEAQCPGTPSQAVPWNQPCSSSVTITDRLNMFSAWRGLSQDNNAYWTLLSTCNTGAAVGLAWLGQLCNTGSQTAAVQGGGNETIASANVVVKTSTEWQVIAHETGHTFGAVHDCTSQTCSDGTVGLQQCCPLSASSCNANSMYIMNPSTGDGIKNFSPCSIGNICSAMGRNAVKSTCLANNKDVVTFTGEAQCGNGIVEEGEDCDCGGAQSCGNNACCDASTCKFKTGAVCDPSNEDCCTTGCQFATAGSVCRASTGVCDPQETCTGTSALCPADAHQADGTSCDSSRGLTCASGQCTSRDLQCQTMIGAQTNAANDTYACSSQGCTLSCASPQFGSNMCVVMNQNFLDGTSCEGGGRCGNGVCQGASVANEISSWIQDNKNIFIPVVAVLGALVLVAVLSCCWRAVGRRRRYRRVAARRANKPVFGASPTPTPPPMVGPGVAVPPVAAGRGPPPGYTSSYPGRGSPGPQYVGQQWYPPHPSQGRSMRYA